MKFDLSMDNSSSASDADAEGKESEAETRDPSVAPTEVDSETSEASTTASVATQAKVYWQKLREPYLAWRQTMLERFDCGDLPQALLVDGPKGPFLKALREHVGKRRFAEAVAATSEARWRETVECRPQTFSIEAYHFNRGCPPIL